MLIDACGSGLGIRTRDSAADMPSPAATKPDATATPDAGPDARAVDAQTIDVDHGQPADGGKTDLWDTICE